MKLLAALLLAVCVSACGSPSPVAPAPVLPVVPTAPAITALTYAINLPSPGLVTALQRAYPDGLRLDPYTAQQDYDYTWAYGSPNIYVGETAPTCPIVGDAVVVAPLRVAIMEQFTAGDWPSVGLAKNTTYVWVGRFTYAIAPEITPRRCQEPATHF
jgi:hypothetical protein